MLTKRVCAATALLTSYALAGRGGKGNFDLPASVQLMAGECAFLEGSVVLFQMEKDKPKPNNPDNIVTTKANASFAVKYLQPETFYELNVRDLPELGGSFGMGSCDGPVIEPLASFETDLNGSYYENRVDSFIGLFDSYDFFFGSDVGRMLSLDIDGEAQECCIINAEIQDDKEYLRKTLKRNLRMMQNEIQTEYEDAMIEFEDGLGFLDFGDSFDVDTMDSMNRRLAATTTRADFWDEWEAMLDEELLELENQLESQWLQN